MARGIPRQGRHHLDIFRRVVAANRAGHIGGELLFTAVRRVADLHERIKTRTGEPVRIGEHCGVAHAGVRKQRRRDGRCAVEVLALGHEVAGDLPFLLRSDEGLDQVDLIGTDEPQNIAPDDAIRPARQSVCDVDEFRQLLGADDRRQLLADVVLPQ